MTPKYFLVLFFGALTHLGALAHESHGMPGHSHWHATDALGFVGLGVLALAVWFINKRK